MLQMASNLHETNTLVAVFYENTFSVIFDKVLKVIENYVVTNRRFTGAEIRFLCLTGHLENKESVDKEVSDEQKIILFILILFNIFLSKCRHALHS